MQEVVYRQGKINLLSEHDRFTRSTWLKQSAFGTSNAKQERCSGLTNKNGEQVFAISIVG